MPFPKAIQVNLGEKERKGLEQLVRRHSIGQQIAMPGRIILAAGQGQKTRGSGFHRLLQPYNGKTIQVVLSSQGVECLVLAPEWLSWKSTVKAEIYFIGHS